MSMFGRRALISVATGGWASRSSAIAAYQPIGAASLAASYTDLTGNGNHAAAGNAPSFSALTGWTFNGVNNYLTGGSAHTALSGTQDQPFTMIFRGKIDNMVGGNHYVYGWSSTISQNPLSYIGVTDGPPDYTLSFMRDDAAGTSATNATTAYTQNADAVYAIVYDGTNMTFYVDGVPAGATAVDVGVATFNVTGIGALVRSTIIAHYKGTIAALVAHDTNLSASQIAADSAEMAALS